MPVKVNSLYILPKHLRYYKKYNKNSFTSSFTQAKNFKRLQKQI